MRLSLTLKPNHNPPTYTVGYKFINKQGLGATVCNYRGRKDIDIQFEEWLSKHPQEF